MKKMIIKPLPILKDNYIWLIIDPITSKAVAIDPGEAQPLFDLLEKEKLELCAILITHHHWDHCNGLAQLKNHFNIPTYGPHHPALKEITQTVKESDTIQDLLPSITLSVLEIPGHTLEHIAYYMKGALFCGDTLFSAGCGRIFEGTPEQMYHSIQKLISLPDETNIYCAHEYTLKNIQFAQLVEPDNIDIKNKLSEVINLRNNNLPTLPTLLSSEKKINPFLRCQEKSIIERVREHTHLPLDNPVDIFASLRDWKNNY